MQYYKNHSTTLRGKAKLFNEKIRSLEKKSIAKKVAAASSN